MVEHQYDTPSTYPQRVTNPQCRSEDVNNRWTHWRRHSLGSVKAMPVAPHIARLREKVGHDLLLLPSVAVLPLDNSGRVLIARQTEFGTYATVGGSVDVDESPLDAARRRHARRSAPTS
ncbi:NUDIX domain-containing protein [Ornithinimicrobium sufpigmenti]|uniref:NUDIX domain-containing protein n=1 Tax=Ornithinimicrobium sufpigmenti TaxID=2508882 RepID=UPI003CE57F4D